MSRINTNVNSLIAQRVLKGNNEKLNQSLTRLSTGLKINTGADNPAGLIASENLRAEKVGIQAALSNAERAGNIVATAEGGLSEISSLLNEVQGLVNETANSGGLSREEIEANQLQVDAILNTINRLAGSVTFQGKKLLNGELGYQTAGANLSAVSNLQVHSARLPEGASQNVAVAITGSAQMGLATYTSAGAHTAHFTLQIAGNRGTEQLSFLSSVTNAGIAAAVNAIKDVTGVTATVSGNALRLNSSEYGSQAFVSVKTISGTSGIADTKDFGQDATVTVNGSAADVNGLNVKFRNSNLDLQFDLLVNMGATAVSKQFEITGGGATFSLGAKVTEADKTSLGINSVSTGSLGLDGSALSSLASGGANSLTSGNLTTAQRVVDEATKQISQTRGRLGAFQKFVINSTVNQLGVAYENASAAESAIRDTDFAFETAQLTRAQILAQASTNVLAQSNSLPQLALQLLS